MSDADPASPPPNPQPVHCMFPVPPIGLTCPNCGYELTGLTEPRCPECAHPFDLDALFDHGIRMNAAVRLTMLGDMLGPSIAPVERLASDLALRTGTTITSAVGILAQACLDVSLERDPDPRDFERWLDGISTHTRLLVSLPRPPRRVGRDFDFPDCQFACSHCKNALVGVRNMHCPSCGRRIDVESLLPRRTLVALNREIGRNQNLPNLLMRTALEHEGIPNDAHTASGSALGTIGGIELTALRVPRSYYFDALAFLQGIRDEHAATTSEGNAEWTCPDCREAVPGNFEVCWNCGAMKP